MARSGEMKVGAAGGCGRGCWWLWEGLLMAVGGAADGCGRGC
jgi:hypothetical protein